MVELERASNRPRHSARRMMYAVVTVLMGGAVGYWSALPLFRGRLQDYLGVDMKVLAILFAFGYLPGGVLAIAAGAMSHRWGPRRVLRTSMFGVAAGMILTAACQQWYMILAGVVIAAAFSPAFTMSSQAYLVDLFPSSPRRVLSIQLLVMGAVGVVYPVGIEWLLGLPARNPAITFAHIFHIPFAVLGAVLLAGALLYRKGKTLSLPRHQEAPPTRWDWIRISPGGLLLIVLMALHGACDNSVYNWMSIVLDSKSYSRTTFAPGHVMAVFAVIYMLSRAVLSALPERFGRRAMMVLPGLLGGGLLLTGLLLRQQATTAAGYVIGAFFWAFEFPTFMARLSAQEGPRFGAALAVQSLVVGLLLPGMTFLMGCLGDAQSEDRLWTILLIPAAGFLLVGIGGAVWLAVFGKRTT